MTDTAAAHTTATAVPSVTLNDGRTMPQIGLGTFLMPPGDTQRLVESAIDAGYRHIDTAKFYENEAEVGAAVRARRETIFVTTKLWRDDMGYDAALRAFDRSFDQLGLDWLDLYLIHWPEPQTERYVESWKALVRLREEGRVKSIGVSNFTMAHLEHIIDETGVIPAVNQVECHPRFQQVELRAFCEENGIAVTSWSPLGRGTVLDDPEIARIAAKHGKSPGQVILRWHLDQGLIVIPKASSSARLAENLAVTGFALDEEDLAAIARLDEADGRIGPDPDDTPSYRGIPERKR
jgi:2,5-diketo-D-gluconate reductase A